MSQDYRQELNEILAADPLVYTPRLETLTEVDSSGPALKEASDITHRVESFNNLRRSPLEIDIGFGPTNAEIQPYELWLYYLPLASFILEKYDETEGRFLIGISGAPGVGKSYKTAALCAVIQRVCAIADYVDWVPFDGFHFPNEYLEANHIHRNGETLSTHPILTRLPNDGSGFYLEDGQRIPLKRIKGMAPTFDAEAAIQKYAEFLRCSGGMWFPTYSRELHDPIAEGKCIGESTDILLAEGNFLFLDEGRYQEMYKLFDLKIFLESHPEANKQRCFARHLAGNKSRAEAQTAWDYMDGPNQDIINTTKDKADLIVRVEHDSAISCIEVRD